MIWAADQGSFLEDAPQSNPRRIANMKFSLKKSAENTPL
jgi:hypothetical protein